MTYTPIGKLGTTPVNTNFSFVSSFTLESGSVTETILNCVVLYNIYDDYINHNFNGSSVTLTGNVPLSVFNQYQLTYVDKGESDKTQTPVVCGIDSMPDHKELYKIQQDTRVSIYIPITINLTVEKRTIGLTPEEDIVETSQIIIEYTLEVLNNLSYIGNWTKNYFQNRY